MLTADEYDELLRRALQHEGLTAEQAEQLIAARWPMDGHGAIHEANGRGWHLTEDDVADFLVSALGREVELAEARFNAEGVDALLAWAGTSDRGRPTMESAYHYDATTRRGVLCN